MVAIPASMRYAFRALSVRAYRRYFWARTVSALGTWMQSIAQAWLVLELTGSGAALGLVLTLQFLPLLCIGPLAGVWVERMDKRRVMIWTQVALTVLAALLGVLTVSGIAELWMVYAFALLYGIATVFAMPAQNVIVLEMVSPELFSNAVSMNLFTFNTARVLGPALAGATIAVVGIGTCFLLNALSFLPMIVALLLIKPSDLRPTPRQARAPGQLREGFRMVWHTPELLGALVVLLLFGIFAWEFEVSIPLVTKEAFDGDSALYGLLSAAIGLGAVIGTVFAARRPKPTNRSQLASLMVTGAAFAGAALAPTLWLEFVTLALAGAALSAWYALLTARYQTYTPHDFQARGMALWGTALNGARPVGGPIVGLVGNEAGARATLLLGCFGIFVLAVPAWARLSRHGIVATLAGRGETPHLTREPATTLPASET